MAAADRIQIRKGTTAAATSADDTLANDADGAEFAITDDRVAGVGDVRGWFGDPDDMSFTDQVAVDSRGVWATPGDLDAFTGGGDASTNTATSVVNEGVLFADTTGKLLKRATGTGIVKRTSGVDSIATAGTDYYNPGGTDVAVADGGTGSSTASAARTALGLAIGTDVQAHDGDLDTIAGLTATTDSFIQSKSSAWAARTVAQVKTDLGLTGTNSGDQTITLTGDVTGSGTGSFAATVANDAVTYAKMQNVSATDMLLGRATAGAGDVEEIALTAAGRALIDDATTANQRTTLGLVIGTDVLAPNGSGALLTGIPESAVTNLTTDLAAKQPLDSDLTTIAGLTATTDNFLVAVASAWASRTPAQVKTTLAIAESDVANLTTDLAAKQPLDSDLTTIAGLTATTDNFLVSVASAWASRTPAQVKTTLAIAVADVSGAAPLASPTFTGTPAAPTAAQGTNTTQVATTAMVHSEAVLLAPLASPTFSGTVTIAALAGILKGTAGAVSAATAGTDYTSPSSTETQTNKRKTPRVFSTASTATLTPEIDTYDAFDITAQAAGLTIANHSTSTPTNFEQMRIRILDNGTARSITFGTNYSARAGVALPTITTLSKYMELGFEWWAGLSKWALVALLQEA